MAKRPQFPQTLTAAQRLALANGNYRQTIQKAVGINPPAKFAYHRWQDGEYFLSGCDLVNWQVYQYNGIDKLKIRSHSHWSKTKWHRAVRHVSLYDVNLIFKDRETAAEFCRMVSRQQAHLDQLEVTMAHISEGVFKAFVGSDDLAKHNVAAFADKYFQEIFDGANKLATMIKMFSDEESA